jgi:hypothetical protein
MNLILKTPIKLKAKNTSFYIQVNSVEIPFSFYQLSNDISSLNCTFVNGATIKNKQITLSPGNYNSNSVLNELKTKLIDEAKIPELGYTPFTPDLNFTYSGSTGKSTFTMSNVGCQIILNFFENQNLGLFFGCDTNILISPLSSHVSNKICVANPITSLYVRSPTFKQTNNVEFVVESDVYSDIIKQVPILTNINTYIQDYQDSDLIYISNNEINDFNIYLSSNINYNPIDLGGLEWNLSLSILEVIQPLYEPIVPIINTLDLQRALRSEGEKEGSQTYEDIEEMNRLNNLEKQKEDIINKLGKYKNILQERLNGDMGYLEKLIEKKKTKEK